MIFSGLVVEQAIDQKVLMPRAAIRAIFGLASTACSSASQVCWIVASPESM
jgi:hypothetical protein